MVVGTLTGLIGWLWGSLALRLVSGMVVGLTVGLVAGEKASYEPVFARRYLAAVGPATQMWTIPGGYHVSGPVQVPEAHAKRLVEFFLAVACEQAGSGKFYAVRSKRWTIKRKIDSTVVIQQRSMC